MSNVKRLPLRAPVCGECGKALSAPTGTRGRPRKWCSDRCRARARRRRVALPWPPVAPAGYPRDPIVVRRRTIEALVAVMEGEPAAPPIDQLAQGLLELDWLAYRLEALERELPRRLAGRASELGSRVRSARRRLFPEIEEVAHG